MKIAKRGSRVREIMWVCGGIFGKREEGGAGVEMLVVRGLVEGRYLVVRF